MYVLYCFLMSHRKQFLCILFYLAINYCTYYMCTSTIESMSLSRWCNIYKEFTLPKFVWNSSPKAGNSLSRPAGRFCPGRSSWDVVGHRPGIGYVSSKNRGIGRASCVEPMPARRWPAVSNMFDTAGRPTPARHPAGRCFGLFLVRKHHTRR